ncbi:MAG TPA: hypothetical protein VKV69_13500, partial [Actinomycetota bacterium]|nr:hypothetical protein [Actinomycetota bacterium]
MPARRLFLASFLSLFVELALIRWIPGTLHIVGFFANLVLIASFLGLGIGLADPPDNTDTPRRALVRLGVLMAGLAVVEIVGIKVSLPKAGDYAINEVQSGFPISIPLPIVLLIVYAGAVWATIPFGQLVAEQFDRLERIPAYSINIAGSMAGVAAFSLVSWLSLPPLVWFGAIALVCVALHPSRANAVPILLIAAVIGGLQLHDSRALGSTIAWSPYYKVVTHSVVPHGSLDQGFITDVNGQFLLSGLDLRPNATLPPTVSPQVRADVQSLKSYYDFPFAIAHSDRVLILGAGAGNDVAAALRHGVSSVVAVEIDPLVQRLGANHHPEHPYSSPKVRVVINDGRAFLDHDTERFDLIEYATLDAHGLLSAATSVRLDSFIYTRQSLEQAKKHLARDGLLVLSFGPFREDVQYRQYEMVKSVFGQDPLYFEHTNGHRTIVAG